MKHLLWSSVVGLGTLVALSAQEARPRFEVASVRVNNSGQGYGYYDPRPARFTATSMSIVELAALAYRLPNNRIVAPDNLPKGRFDIVATIPSESGMKDFPERLQRLLEDRFALRARRETRDLPIYALVRSRPDGPLGPNLVPMEVCTDAPKGGPSCGSLQYSGGANGTMAARRTWSALRLVEHLGVLVNRVVLDKTGLTGWFDVRLEWNPQTTGAAAAADGVDNRPSLFQALEDQLGLKLESTRGPVDVLVIDSVQQPSEN